ncbi:hypothetical protein C8Q74DRAFT_1277019, partial [Fomes fomentarius]
MCTVSAAARMPPIQIDRWDKQSMFGRRPNLYLRRRSAPLDRRPSCARHQPAGRALHRLCVWQFESEAALALAPLPSVQSGPKPKTQHTGTFRVRVRREGASRVFLLLLLRPRPLPPGPACFEFELINFLSLPSPWLLHPPQRSACAWAVHGRSYVSDGDVQCCTAAPLECAASLPYSTNTVIMADDVSNKAATLDGPYVKTAASTRSAVLDMSTCRGAEIMYIRGQRPAESL